MDRGGRRGAVGVVGAVVAVAAIAGLGCGRFGFDPLAGGGDAGTDGGGGSLSIVHACKTTATVGVSYGCEPTGPVAVAGELLTWHPGAGHSCTWMQFAAATGKAIGTPVEPGPCLAVLEVTSPSRGTDQASWMVTVGVEVVSVAQVDVGASHTCALSTAGTVRCWGANSSGQLGYDDTLPVGQRELRAARRWRRAVLGPRRLLAARLRPHQRRRCRGHWWFDHLER